MTWEEWGWAWIWKRESKRGRDKIRESLGCAGQGRILEAQVLGKGLNKGGSEKEGFRKEEGT